MINMSLFICYIRIVIFEVRKIEVNRLEWCDFCISGTAKEPSAFSFEEDQGGSCFAEKERHTFQQLAGD